MSEIKSTNPKIEQLKAELVAEEQRELKARRERLWAIVKDLKIEDLKLLGWMIHVHFHGDGEDD